MRTMNKVIMTLAGLLLIAAAGLKFYEMVDTCVPAWQAKAAAAVVTAEKASEQLPQWKATMFGIWESYEFNLFQIPLEFALGVWLVSGLFRKAAWIAGTLAFFGFIFVTVGKWMVGAESCGCFGQIHVDPRITLFAVDIPIFLLLAIFRPKGYKLLPPPWPNLVYLLFVFVPTIGLMVTAPPVIVALRPECKKADDQKVDPSAQLKLEIYQLNQDLKKQTQIVNSSQQQIDSQNETIKQLTQQIESLTAQTETLKNQLLTHQQTPPEPNMVEPVTNNGQNSEVEVQDPPETTPAQNNTVQQATDTNDQPPAQNQWDWLQYVVEDDVRKQLTDGLVVVMMHRFDCPTCEEMAPLYSEYYAQMVEKDDILFKIAFLAMPPYGKTDHVPDDSLCIQGKLTDEENWELMSPYVLALIDGELLKTWPEGTAPKADNLFDEMFE